MTIGTRPPIATPRHPAPAFPALQSPSNDQPSPLSRAIRGAAGVATGTLGAIYYAPIGLVQGMDQALVRRDEKDTTWYHLMLDGQAAALGAVAGGAVGGPVGAFLGAGAGWTMGVIGSFWAEVYRADERFVDAVQKAVDRAMADNPQGNSALVTTRNLIEGGLVGMLAGAREGYRTGYDIVNVVDVVEE